MRIAALLLLLLLTSGPALAEESVAELNKQLANPVSSLWSIAFQQNNFLIDPGRHEDLRWNSNLNFQPVMPVAINEDWNLITRPVITAFNSVPHPRENTTPLDWTRSETFGDSVLMELVSPSPKLAGRWLLGLGPTFIFPTANSKWVGQGKYQAGPAGLVGYLDEKWILGALVQQWYSFSGAGGSRDSTRQMNFQPVAAYFLEDGWSVGYSGNILANWKADAGNVWTVPLGVAVGKVQKFGKLQIKIQLAVQYMVARPDEFGQKWNFQLMFVPVLPKLIKGNLADPSSLHFGMGMGN
ncbi:MAG: hypothetical protein WEF50_07215 [Myxococcota bacterium]